MWLLLLCALFCCCCCVVVVVDMCEPVEEINNLIKGGMTKNRYKFQCVSSTNGVDLSGMSFDPEKARTTMPINNQRVF